MLSEFQYKRICYYTNWAQYRPGFGKFTPQDVDPFLCTHLVYAYATIDNSMLKPSEWNDDSTPEMKGMYVQTLLILPRYHLHRADEYVLHCAQ